MNCLKALGGNYMNNQIAIVVLVVPVLIALGVQAFTISQLADQVDQLSSKVIHSTSQQLGVPNYPILIPKDQNCEDDAFQGKRESL
jgi:hypothetical protein